MNKSISLVLLLSLLLPCRGDDRPCPFHDAAWQALELEARAGLLRNPSVEKRDRDCFTALLGRLSAAPRTPGFDTLFSFLAAHCASVNAFELSVLRAFLDAAGAPLGGAPAHAVTRLWESYRGPLRRQLAQYEERGFYAQADSVYACLHRLSLIDVFELLDWSRIKGIIEDYRGAADLFCEVSRQRTNLTSVAQSQFAGLLEHADSPDIKRDALQRYQACFLETPGADSLALSRWISAVYSRYSLFDEEIRVIAELDYDQASRGERLLNAALSRFSRQLFTEAIPAALRAWPSLLTDAQRRQCAVILYQSYHHRGSADSAVIWLDKVALTTEAQQKDAAVIFQHAGLLEKAAGILRSMPPSIFRDTMSVRQRLFENRLEDAHALVTGWPADAPRGPRPADRYLWLIRIAVFRGSDDDAARYLDSINAAGFPPSWEYAREVLLYRMAMERTGAHPAAFSAYGAIRYCRYTGRPHHAVPAFDKAQAPPAIRTFLAEVLLDALIEGAQFEKADAALAGIAGESASPPIVFYRGLIRLNRGEPDAAKKEFEQIIRTNPHTVFAHKARIYLLPLNEPPRL